jgi:long-chain acyl-CoA synthetase
MLESIEKQIWNIAQHFPEKTAVICGKKQISYNGLCSSISAAKDKLTTEYGLKPSDCLIIAANKKIEFIYAYFGAHIAGLTVIPVDAQINSERLQFIVQQTKPSLAIGLKSTESALPSVELSEFDIFSSSEWNTPLFINMKSVADIMFTTGTTGLPKGVPLTFENEAAAARNINDFIQNTADDIELLALPISHSFGLGRLRCCLSMGSTIIMLGSFANIKKIYRTLDEEKVTGFSMVPASWRYLNKMSGTKLSEYANQLKYIEMGSAFFSAEEKMKLANLLPQTRICMHYGLTEASRSAFMEFHEDVDHLSSVGKASPYTDIKIMDDQGQEVNSNIEGEICVKGEHVTSGYLNTSDNDTFFSGYFRTGDWGYLTTDGYLYLSSRKKDLINVGGKKVSPEEVEEQIMKVYGVKDCACIATPDPEGMLGEVVKAFIVKESADITFETIRKQLESQLEYYKLPVVWDWIEEIPKTSNGKIQRILLR